MRRILFVCGCLEKGKDGVGDYTRTMTQGLVDLGFECRLISINDPYQETTNEKNIYRISTQLHLLEREKIILEIIKEFKPSLISLQFVPYSFDNKGIIKKFIPLFQSISKGIPLHIMFHELWIDIDPNPSIKTRITGYLQRKCIKDLIRKTDPILVTTSNSFYFNLLQKYKITAQVLPLLSNIQFQKNINYSDVENIFQCSSQEKEQYFVVCFFGSIYDSWDYNKYFEKLLPYVASNHKKLMVLAIGKYGNSGVWENLHQKFKNRIAFRTSGHVNENIVSTLLSFSDIGISTTPAHLIAKSGSFVAMKQHGLTVMLTRKFDAIPIYLKPNDQILDTSSFEFDINFKNSKNEPSENYNHQICEQFVQLIDKII